MTRGRLSAETVSALGSGLVVLILAAVFVPMALTRLADADEGAYLLAAKLVAQGQRPYVDFFYPQTPLLPYLYGAWMNVVGVSWYGGRMLSTLFAIVLGLTLHRHVARVTGQPAPAFLATGLFAFSGLAFAWYPTVKTFAFPTLMLFLAASLLGSRPLTSTYFLSGLCLGLAVDTRVYVIVVLPALAIEVVRREHGRAILQRLGAMAAGLMLALVPTLYFYIASPDTFVFNILGVHAIRSTAASAIGEFAQKASTVMTLLTLEGVDGAISLQFTILLVLNVAFIGSRLVTRERLPASISIAVLLLLVSLLPTPTYTQYACMALPFMVMNAAVLIADLRTALVSRPLVGRRLRPALFLLVALYVGAAAMDFRRYVASGDVTPSLNADDWRIETINAVARAIDELAPVDNPLVITWWPGYVVESRASILPRTENHFILRYAAKLSPREIQRYQYMTIEELIWNIRHHTVRVVVLGNWVFNEDRAAYRHILAESDYVVVRRIGDAQIYRWRGQAS